jgi:hypothetical protein
MALTPAKSLPAAVINREKTGFCVPVRKWVMGDGEFDSLRGLRGWAMKVYGELRA